MNWRASRTVADVTVALSGCTARNHTTQRLAAVAVPLLPYLTTVPGFTPFAGFRRLHCRRTVHEMPLPRRLPASARLTGGRTSPLGFHSGEHRGSDEYRGAACVRRIRAASAGHRGALVGDHRHRGRDRALRLPDAGRHPAL